MGEPKGTKWRDREIYFFRFEGTQIQDIGLRGARMGHHGFLRAQGILDYRQGHFQRLETKIQYLLHSLMITIINYMLICITIGATKLITTRADGVLLHCKNVHKKCYTAVFGVLRLIRIYWQVGNTEQSYYFQGITEGYCCV